MKELSQKLQEASKAYYQEDREVMSNLEYDRLYDELQKLEQEQEHQPNPGKNQHADRVFFPGHLFLFIYPHHPVNQILAGCQDFGKNGFFTAHHFLDVGAQGDCQNDQ